MAETPEDFEHTNIEERITPIFNLAASTQGQKEHQVLEGVPLAVNFRRFLARPST